MSDNRHTSFETLILRAWTERSEGAVRWRFRLQDVRTGQHRAFASFDALLHYLDDAFGTSDTDSVEEESTT